jgi:hypothetical protein
MIFRTPGNGEKLSDEPAIDRFYGLIPTVLPNEYQETKVEEVITLNDDTNNARQKLKLTTELES